MRRLTTDLKGNLCWCEVEMASRWHDPLSADERKSYIFERWEGVLRMLAEDD